MSEAHKEHQTWPCDHSHFKNQSEVSSVSIFRTTRVRDILGGCVSSFASTVCIRKYYASQLLCFFEIWKTLGSVSKIRKYYVSQILCFSPYYCRGFLTAFPTTVEKCRTASSNFTQTRKCGFNKKLHRCGNEVCSDLHSQTSAARTALRAVQQTHS